MVSSRQGSESPGGTPAPVADLHRALIAVDWLRWGVVALLLLISLLEPVSGRFGAPNWALVLAFGIYNLTLDLLKWYWRREGHRIPPAVSDFAVDLPVAGVLYYLAQGPGSVLFVLMVLAVVCASASMNLRASLVFTALSAVLTALIEPTLPSWVTSASNLRELGARLAILALAGTGTAVLARRLALEHDMARLAQEEAARLEESGRMRDDFVSTVSHGLKTPFTAVRAGLGLIEASMSDRMRPEERQLMSEVRHNADRAGMRINDLLALNQLEAHSLRLDVEPLDMRDVIADAIATVHPLIIDKGQVLEADLPEPLPMLGDRRRLEQVVVNLLDNAHLHTPSGTCISVSGHEKDGELLLVVGDTGPGIPREEHAAIFERFHRADPIEGGWGLGLAIARVIVQLHKGRIWVESEPRCGARFYVALPNGTKIARGS